MGHGFPGGVDVDRQAYSFFDTGIVGGSQPFEAVVLAYARLSEGSRSGGAWCSDGEQW